MIMLQTKQDLLRASGKKKVILVYQDLDSDALVWGLVLWTLARSSFRRSHFLGSAGEVKTCKRAEL